MHGQPPHQPASWRSPTPNSNEATTSCNSASPPSSKSDASSRTASRFACARTRERSWAPRSGSRSRSEHVEDRLLVEPDRLPEDERVGEGGGSVNFGRLCRPCPPAHAPLLTRSLRRPVAQNLAVGRRRGRHPGGRLGGRRRRNQVRG